MPAEEGIEPRSEIRHSVWRRHADVAQVAGAVARRNVHAPAKRYREVCVIAADAGPIVKGFQRRARHARVLIAEDDMTINIIADRLHAPPSRWRLSEELPRRFG